MGLLGALVGLPLAPLKGLAGLARHIQRQAEREQDNDLAELQAELLELQLQHDEQRAGEEEFASKEAELLEKIGALAGARDER